MKLFSTPPVLSGKKNKKRKKLLKAQRKALKRADHPFESDKAADCRGVVLSNRAYLSVLSEVYSRDPLKTGGIFFGNVKNGVWYVAEASDPGVYTLHTHAHHEMDNNYHNHIYPVLSRLYRHGLCLLGLWHRHPGSLDTFSSDDDRTNHSFAEVIGNGAGSADTGYYYLLATDETYADTFKNPDHTTRGLIVSGTAYTALLSENVVLTGYDYFGTYKDGGWLFNRCDEAKSTLTVDSFTLIHDLFSRNTGLFESAEMLKKFAVIIGCGSVGARAALELARAGVGKFLLIDDDILKPHNICRHTHGMRDLGRFKADLLREDILNIDPAAEVTAFRGKLENAPLSLFENLGKNGIVFATADDRSANALANALSNTLGMPFIAVGCWARAHAGEVFYHIPNRGMKTYGETFSALLKDAPVRDTHGDYFGEADARERLHFEPGTSTDIGFVTLVGVKFALDLLNLESEAYTPRVLNDYTPYTLICNTNRPEIGGENAKIFPYPLYISRSIRPASEA